MLCGHCEDLFSSHESEFARLVFHPFADRSTLTAKYGGWLRKFAVSVCWRILEEYTLENRLGHFQGRWTADLVSCRETWKRYLSGKLPDVGRHHVHLLPWNGVTGAEGVELSASLNPHLRRTIEMDVPCSDRDSFVYAKLGPLLLFGLIADPDPKQWRGTRINAEGKLKSRDIAVPGEFSNYVAARTRLQHPSIGMV
jgi:hypothetical protein